ncbi:MAG: virulence protein RhuM/Fic/DOC family protein [Vicingaceae bacterium]
MSNKIEIYKSDNSQIFVEVKFEKDTIWLSQKQMALLFDKDTDTISLHLKNIYDTKELTIDSTTEDFSVVQKEGKRRVKRTIKHYNLDAIISVGYRVNSLQGTQFRQWATQRLKEHLIDGYTINKERLKQKNQEVIHLKTGIKILNRLIDEKEISFSNNWLRKYANGLKLLDDYDHEKLDKKGISNSKTKFPSLNEYQQLIAEMRTGINSDIFGIEKDESFKSAVAQIEKGNKLNDYYPSIEEKAATLLYLIIKNHAFVDGNKRIAAACFLLFLEKNNILHTSEESLLISNEALATLTLFIASSKAEEMESVKKLTVSILNRSQK